MQIIKVVTQKLYESAALQILAYIVLPRYFISWFVKDQDLVTFYSTVIMAGGALLSVVNSERTGLVDILRGKQNWLVKTQSKFKINTVRPGKLSIFLAGILHSPENREFALGCIEERYIIFSKKYGVFYAKSWLCWDIAVSIYSKCGSTVFKFLKWLGLGLAVEKLSKTILALLMKVFFNTFH